MSENSNPSLKNDFNADPELAGIQDIYKIALMRTIPTVDGRSPSKELENVYKAGVAYDHNGGMA